jgi:hypothetical protein
MSVITFLIGVILGGITSIYFRIRRIEEKLDAVAERKKWESY